MIDAMRRLLILFVLLLPISAYAYTSVIARPADQKAVLSIRDAEVAEEFFGRLDGFPHTYTFNVLGDQSFKASLSVPDMSVQKNDISLIIVKAERRGVSEIGRTKSKELAWESSYDTMLAESFRSGGSLEGSLEPGTYTLEVSSPNNNGKYRLVWGTEKVSRGYFAHLRVLFEVKSFLDNSKVSTLKSPLVFTPLLIFALVALFVWYRRRNR